MTTLIKVPCEDGAQYDLYVEPPEGMDSEEAVRQVEETVRAYFETSGEIEIMDQLREKGFIFPEIIETEETW